MAEQNELLKNQTFLIEKETYHDSQKPLIVGTGPAGLFAALRLVERGIPCRLFERGSRSEQAMNLALAEMYVQGVFTRKVITVLQKLVGPEIVRGRQTHLDSNGLRWH